MDFFKGTKIKKALVKFTEASSARDEQKAISTIMDFGDAGLRHAIEAFQQKSLNSIKAHTLLDKICGEPEQIIPLLTDPYHEVRRVAKELISKKWPNSASPLLVELLKSQDIYARNNAAELLSSFKDQRCVPELVNVFNQGSAETKKSVIKVFGYLEGQTGKKLVMSALNDADWHVRLAAVKCLGKIRAPESVDILIEKLSERDPHMKKLALDSLIAIGDKRAARPVIDLIRDDDLLVRQQATDCLIQIADSSVVPEILNLMRDSDVNIRRCAVEVLKNMKDPRTADELLRAMKDSDWWVRQIATSSLTEITGDNNIVRAFIAMTKDQDENIRRCAVEFFNKISDPSAFDALVERLEDEDWWVRQKAIRALGLAKDKRAIEHFAKLISDTIIGWAVPVSLAMIGGNEAYDLLKRYLFVDIKRTKLETVKVFGRIKNQESVGLLEQCLQDPDKDIVHEAIRSLKHLTGKAYQPTAVTGQAPARAQRIVSTKVAPGSTVTEAILVLDLCNSTDIVNRYGDNFAFGLLQKLTDMISPIAQREQCCFTKGTGDGFLMTFPKAENSVRFAKEVFVELAKYNAQVDEMSQINIRFAINLGEAKVDENGDRLGLSVNMTFRIEGVKPDSLIPIEGGMNAEDMPMDNRILITETIYKEMQGAGEHTISLIGLFELKGITGLHRVYALT